jgi:hypothetical protein
MNEELVLGATYQHYKGNHYKVLAVVKHSETEEDLVLYETLYENPMSRLWVRPVSMFLEDIEINGERVPRFRLKKDS